MYEKNLRNRFAYGLLGKPVKFFEIPDELRKIRGFEKYIHNFSKTLGYLILNNKMDDGEIENFYLSINVFINNYLEGRNIMSSLDDFLQELDDEQTETEKVLQFCRRMQQKEYEKNQEFWLNKKIKDYFKNVENLLRVLIKHKNNDKLSYVFVLSKDLLTDTYLISLYEIKIIKNEDDERITYKQKSKTILYDDKNGERPPKHKTIINLYIKKLKQTIDHIIGG